MPEGRLQLSNIETDAQQISDSQRNDKWSISRWQTLKLYPQPDQR